MTCKQCKNFQRCMDEAFSLEQVFDPNYDGEYGCLDFSVLTNADRIRAMSDEELAKFLAAKFSDLQSQQLLGESSQLTATELSVLAHTWYCQWMYWLRQPAKDGDGDD